MSEELELSRRDEANGIRMRRFNAKVDALAKRYGLDPDAARAFAVSSITDACRDTDRKAVASDLGIDWQGLTQFMEALAPIILQFMAACGA